MRSQPVSETITRQMALLSSGVLWQILFKRLKRASTISSNLSLHKCHGRRTPSLKMEEQARETRRQRGHRWNESSIGRVTLTTVEFPPPGTTPPPPLFTGGRLVVVGGGGGEITVEVARETPSLSESHSEQYFCPLQPGRFVVTHMVVQTSGFRTQEPPREEFFPQDPSLNLQKCEPMELGQSLSFQHWFNGVKSI